MFENSSRHITKTARRRWFLGYTNRWVVHGKSQKSNGWFVGYLMGFSIFISGLISFHRWLPSFQETSTWYSFATKYMGTTIDSIDPTPSIKFDPSVWSQTYDVYPRFSMIYVVFDGGRDQPFHAISLRKFHISGSFSSLNYIPVKNGDFPWQTLSSAT